MKAAEEKEAPASEVRHGRQGSASLSPTPRPDLKRVEKSPQCHRGPVPASRSDPGNVANRAGAFEALPGRPWDAQSQASADTSRHVQISTRSPRVVIERDER